MPDKIMSNFALYVINEIEGDENLSRLYKNTVERDMKNLPLEERRELTNRLALVKNYLTGLIECKSS